MKMVRRCITFIEMRSAAVLDVARLTLSIQTWELGGVILVLSSRNPPRYYTGLFHMHWVNLGIVIR